MLLRTTLQLEAETKRKAALEVPAGSEDDLSVLHPVNAAAAAKVQEDRQRSIFAPEADVMAQSHWDAPALRHGPPRPKPMPKRILKA